MYFSIWLSLKHISLPLVSSKGRIFENVHFIKMFHFKLKSYNIAKKMEFRLQTNKIEKLKNYIYTTTLASAQIDTLPANMVSPFRLRPFPG